MTVENYPGMSESQFHFEVSEKNPSPKILDINENALRSVTSTKYLASLSSPLLEEIARNVAEAMVIIQEKKRTVSLGSIETRSRLGRNVTRQNRGEVGRNIQTAVFTCEHPGCAITFNRKKDRKRHFRQKHQGNEHFRCPVVDCSLGTGHEIQRRDKLRDHLRRKEQSPSTWQCILPECSETAVGRTGLIDHLGRHDRTTRLVHQQLLIDYDFISGDIHHGSYYDKPLLGYLMCSYICVVQGCHFGTNSLDIMTGHQSVQHTGSHCPCPMPDCQQVFQDWSTTSAHLARNHDAVDRKKFDKELVDQGFWWRSSVFTCPICRREIKVLLNKVSCDEKVREHCRTHTDQQLLAASEALVRAFASSNRRTLWYPRMPLLDPATDDQVFAYLTWPKTDLPKIWNMNGSAQSHT